MFADVLGNNVALRISFDWLKYRDFGGKARRKETIRKTKT
jgi:hypothetical protein